MKQNIFKGYLTKNVKHVDFNFINKQYDNAALDSTNLISKKIAKIIGLHAVQK